VLIVSNHGGSTEATHGCGRLPHSFSELISMFCLMLFRKFLLGVSRFGNESTCNQLASRLRESKAHYLKTLPQLQTLLVV